MTFVDYTSSEGCARITLVDGQRGNPLHLESVAELLAAVRQAHADAARVIVLAAEGRFFSVGGDLGAFAGAESMPDFIDDLADQLHRLVSELMRSPAIVVSVVQGGAAGAGFPFAAAADVVLAAESASFTLAYTKVGLSNDGGSSLLVHTLGLHTTLRLALLNDSITATEAAAAGLVARVVPDDELSSAVEKVVATLLAGPPEAFATAKRLIRTAADDAPETTMRRELLGIRTQAAGPEAPEGVAAFVEKRRPSF
ncbi:enoyl-CoA hydratase/isomerase family protein [Nocardioides acrostichi]|uniref:Enoyl-CoA hydratase/isomerase family protein n=1 Tax=Nocardioides acrostichi TaxID=2784339 RepID=A0A930Y745_9ACTN|nr:enoyl-CoA hydratase-related protein [Nocardioides acrostichi]MBF4161616.1 enoyl-CoA hydratase/isomerase family protein [Nocardioides acrostichi]